MGFCSEGSVKLCCHGFTRIPHWSEGPWDLPWILGGPGLARKGFEVLKGPYYALIWVVIGIIKVEWPILVCGDCVL